MRMIDQFAATADPFLTGDGTFDHFCLGYPFTDGLMFPWPNGALVLRRRRLYPDVGEWTYCGSADRAAGMVGNEPGFDHEAGMGFQYAGANAFGSGFASAFFEPVRVDFDDAGALIDPPLPMFPVRLTAQAVAGGQFRIRWEYDPYGQGAWPRDFQVFGGAPGAVDYDTPLVDAVTGLSALRVVGAQRSFSFTTPAYAEGAEPAFGVRGRNVNGVAEKNTRVVLTAGAMATAVAAVDSILSAREGGRR